MIRVMAPDFNPAERETPGFPAQNRGVRRCEWALTLASALAVEDVIARGGNPEAVHRLALAVARRGYRRVRTRRAARAFRPQRRVVRVLRPDAAFYGSEDPHEISALRRKLHEIVGVRRVRDDDLVAIYAVRERTERLKALEGLDSGGAGAHAARTLRARDVPRPERPRGFHGGPVDCDETLPAVVQLERGARNRRIRDRLRRFDIDELFLD